MEANKHVLHIENLDTNQLRGILVEVVRTELANLNQNPISEPEDLLTREQICELLNISKVTLWKHEKAGKIQSYGIGARRLYKRQEVLDSLIPKVQ